ncbi:MAG: hypothetical protein IT262_22770, partial [Saprospiraceae bacterium]|nr:hypothetical protein [Saprospiraceae bacterium]
MQHPSDHPFERYIRNKMLALRSAPSDELWERIAKRQKMVVRQRFINRLLVLTGIVSGLLVLLFWDLKCHAVPGTSTLQQVQKSGAGTVPHTSTAATPNVNATTGPAVSNTTPDHHVVENQEKKQRPAPFSTGQRNKQIQTPRHWEKTENNTKHFLLPASVASSIDMVKTIPVQATDQSVQVAPHLNKAVATSNRLISSIPVLLLKELSHPARKLHLTTFAHSPALPDIRPVRPHKWHYGVSFSTGRLHESG